LRRAMGWTEGTGLRLESGGPDGKRSSLSCSGVRAGDATPPRESVDAKAFSEA
jgi:hypothetical protein